MKNDEIIVSCHLVLIPLNTHIIVPVFPGDDINNYLKKSYTELYAVVFRKNNYNKDLAYLLSLLTFKEACILSTHPLATGFCEGRKYYNKFATSNLTSLELEKVAISNELADIKIKLTDLVGESLVMSVISDMIYCGVDLVFSLTFEQAFGTAVN